MSSSTSSSSSSDDSDSGSSPRGIMAKQEEMEKVYKMLEGLDSEDPKKRDAAQERVDKYINKKQRKMDEKRIEKEGDWISGCK